MTGETTFKELCAIDVSKHIEKKGQLNYLSWVWAWKIAKDHDPKIKQKVYENEFGWNYFTDGKTCWVKVGVTMFGDEIIEYLPVMDYKNQSIPVDKVTSMNVNTAIQRAVTKAIGRHGIGLNVYAGEDLPFAEEESQEDIEQNINLLKNAVGMAQDISDLKKLKEENADSLAKCKKINLALYEEVCALFVKRKEAIENV